IQAFRNILRLINKMKQYGDFSFEDLPIGEQEFEDFKSKYLDLYEQTKGLKQGEEKGHSILDDLDFELELIHRDEINVTYIMNLLIKLQGAPQRDKADQEKIIRDLLDSDIHLRSKKELIEKFIYKNLPLITDPEDVIEAFDEFITEERKIALKELSVEEQLDILQLETIIGEYLFTNKTTLRDRSEEHT